MNESRKRFLEHLNSSVFSNDSEKNFSKFRPKNIIHEDFLNLKSFPRLNFPKTQRAQSSGNILNPRQRRLLDIHSDNSVYPKPSEVKIETLRISGLQPSDDDHMLREIAKNFHVIEANTEFDNVKGVCTGKGKIAIRSFNNKVDKQDLILKLSNKGYDVSEETQNTGRKTSINYNFYKSGSCETSRKTTQPKESLENLSTPRYMKLTMSFANKQNRK